MPSYIPDDQVLFSPPDNNKSKYIPDDQVDFNSITTPAGKPVSEIGQAAKYLMRGVATIPEKIGGSLQAIQTGLNTAGLQNPVTDYLGEAGKGMRERIQASKEGHPLLDNGTGYTSSLAIDPQFQEKHPTKAMIGGLGEGVVPFVVPYVGAALPFLYGGSATQEAFEKLKKNNPEMSDKEALAKASAYGTFEGAALHYIPKAGEVIGETILSKVAPSVGETASEALTNTVNPSIGRQIARSIPGVAADTTMFTAQGVTGQVIEKGLNIDPNADPTSAMAPKELAANLLLSSVFRAKSGYHQSKQNTQIRDSLTNPETDPAERIKAAGYVYDALKDQYPEDAKWWKENTHEAIKSGVTIPLDDISLKGPEETAGPASEPSGPISKALATQLPTIDQVQTTDFTPPDTSGTDAQTSAANQDQILNDLMASQETSDRQSNFRTLQRNTAQQNEQAILDQQAAESLRYNQLQNTRGQRAQFAGTADMPVAESPYARPLSPQEQRARDTIASQYDNSYGLEGAPPIKYTSDHDAALYGKDVLTSLRNKQKQEAQNAFDKRKTDYVKENPPAQTEPDQEVPRQVKRQAIKDANEIVNADPVYGHMDEVVKQGGFNLKGMKADFDKDTIRQINRPGLFSRAGKINIDEYAGDNGYKDANEMIEAFKSAKSKTERRQELIPQLTKEWQDGDTAQRQAEQGVTPATDEDVQASIDVIKRHPEDAQDIINHPSFSPEQRQRLVDAHQATLPIRTSTGQPFTSENQARRFANKNGIELGKTHDIAPVPAGGLEIAPKTQPIEAQNANTQRADTGSPGVAGPVGNETGNTTGRIPAAVVGPEGKAVPGAVEAGTGKSIQPVVQDQPQPQEQSNGTERQREGQGRQRRDGLLIPATEQQGQPGMADNQPKADIASAGPVTRTLDHTGRVTDKKGIRSGDTFRTSSGRETTPYPKQKGEKYASQWTIDNAEAEARSRGDEWNARQFKSTSLLKGGFLTEADRASLNGYLFGEQPKVVKSIFKDTSAHPGPVSSVPAESRQLGEKTGQEPLKNMSPDASVTETGTPGSTRTLSGDVSSDKSVTPKENNIPENKTREQYYKGVNIGRKALDYEIQIDKGINGQTFRYTPFRVQGVEYFSVERDNGGWRRGHSYEIRNAAGDLIQSLTRDGRSISIGNNIKNRKEFIDKFSTLLNDNWEPVDSYYYENKGKSVTPKEEKPPAEIAPASPKTVTSSGANNIPAASTETPASAPQGVTSKQPERQERNSYGTSLSREDRKKTLETLTDVYKENHLPKEQRIDGRGEEYFAYPYRPEYFVKSDITGAMVRYYVIMPDSRKAHPTELFPDYTQSKIDSVLQEQIHKEKQEEARKKHNQEIINLYADSDLGKARDKEWIHNKIAHENNKDDRVTFHSDKEGKWFVAFNRSLADSYRNDLTERGYREVRYFKNSAGANERPVWSVKEYADKTEVESSSVEPKKDDGLDDFGEKIGGARKDIQRSTEKEYTSDDIASLPLSKIWPKGEIDAVEDQFAAAFSTAARAEIPRKPQKGYKLTRWVESVKLFRRVNEILAGGNKKEDVARKVREDFPSLKGFFDKVLLLESIPRDQWERIGKVRANPDAYRYGENGEHIPVPSVWVDIDNRHQSFDGAKTVEEIFGRVNDFLSAKEAPESAKSGVQFEVRGSGTSYAINKKGDPEYRKLKTFDSSKEAFDFRKDHFQELVAAWDAVKERDNVKKDDVRRKENRPRVGTDRRNGEDVTPERFMETFGFRGVEFGKWVSQGEGGKDRQGMLNQAFDALGDLADIIGIPTKAVSLNGTLGLGLGSRGSGSASAHYEPDKLVINLTKTRGAGTLGHEFFHALDNYFSRLRGGEVAFSGDQNKYRENNYITYKPEPMMVHKKYGSSGFTKERLAELRAENPTSGYLNDQDNWVVDPKHREGVRPEVSEAFADLVNVIDKSPMSKRAVMADKGKANGYWSRIIERAARSFENYLIQEMMDKGYHNDYLANVKGYDEFSRSKERYPYLKPEEIGPVKEAFDNLFSTIKTKETEKGVALYSQGQGTGTDLSELTPSQSRAVKRLQDNGKLAVIKPEDVEQTLRDVGVNQDNVKKSAGEVKEFLPKGTVGSVLLNRTARSSLGKVFIRTDGSIVADGLVLNPGDKVYLSENGKTVVRELPKEYVDRLVSQRKDRIDLLIRISSDINRKISDEPLPEKKSSDPNDLSFLFEAPNKHAWEKARYPGAGKIASLGDYELVDSISKHHDQSAIKKYIAKQETDRRGIDVAGYLHLTNNNPIGLQMRIALQAYRAKGGSLGKTSLDALGKDYSARFSADGKILGFELPDGRSFIVPGNIEKGGAWPVVLHEVGEHVGKLLLDNPTYKRISASIEARASEQSPTGRAIKKAIAAIPEGTNPEHRASEILAYMVQQNPETTVARRVIALIKQALVKLRISPDILNVKDFAALADMAVRREARKPSEIAGQLGPAKYSMAGEKSQTSPGFDEAKKMEKEGRTRDEIWKKTGAWQIVPGQWSYEIDNSLSSMKMQDGKLGEVLQDKGVFKAYPFLNNVSMKFEDLGANSRGKLLTDSKDRSQIVINFNMTPEQQRSTLTHEIQHIIQDYEGFSPGGKADKAATGDYQKLIGEAESRLVQKRLNMTPEQRKNVPPWRTLNRMLVSEGLMKPGQKPEDVLIRGGNAETKDSYQEEDKKGGAVKSFKDQSISPVIKEATHSLKEMWNGITRAIYPMSQSKNAERSGEILRNQMGLSYRYSEQKAAELDAIARKYSRSTTRIGRLLDAAQSSSGRISDRIFNKMSDAENLKFMTAIEKGEKQPTAELQEIADTITTMFDELKTKVQDLDTGALQTVLENYFPHIWKKDMAEKDVRTILSKRLLEGGKAFTKHRVFESLADGIALGYEPVSYNPLDIAFLKMHEMQKYINAHSFLQEGEKQGLVFKQGAGEKAPTGMALVNGPFGVTTKNMVEISKESFVKGLISQGMDSAEAHAYATNHEQRELDPGEPVFGRRETYRYYTSQDVGHVINNYLSQSLYNSPHVGAFYKAYMGIANILNMFQLGVGSAFHAGFMSAESTISHVALGMKALADGDIKKAGKLFATAPTAAYKKLTEGQEWMDAYLGKTDNPEMGNMVNWLQLAGARKGMDNRFRTDATRKMMQAWQNGNPIGAAIHSPIAFVEQSARPIMEWLVPRYKFAAFGEMANYWAENNPNATHNELRSAMQQIWNRVDSRMGQVNYDRLFINNAAKNMAQALMRAPGWTGGTLVEVGGGAVDLGKAFIDVAKGKKPVLTDKMAYTLAMVSTTMIANGLMTLAFTGEPPEDKDFFAFRTGRLDEHGNPERFMLPTYMKDLLAWSKEPGQTLTNKLHPLLHLAAEVWKNKDYYGVEIRGENDNFLQQMGELVKYGAKAFVPFWMRGTGKAMERGDNVLSMAIPLIGIMPAPSRINKTATENEITRLAFAGREDKAKTKEQYDRNQLRSRLTSKLRQHDPGINDEILQAFHNREITRSDMQSIRRDAMQPPVLVGFKKLTFAEKSHIFDMATPEEQKILRSSFMRAKIREVRNRGYQPVID